MARWLLRLDALLDLLELLQLLLDLLFALLCAADRFGLLKDESFALPEVSQLIVLALLVIEVDLGRWRRRWKLTLWRRLLGRADGIGHRTGLFLGQIGLSLRLGWLLRRRCFTVLDQVLTAQIPFDGVLTDNELLRRAVILKEM